MAAIDKAIAKLDAILAGIGVEPSQPPQVVQVRVNSGVALSSPSTSVSGSNAALSLEASTPQTGGKAEPGGKKVLVTSAQLKVALITSAVPQPNSAKLLKMQADLGGGETRQIMAGLQQFISPADLQGRLVVVVANLKPAKLAGEHSEAMVLAASCSRLGSDGQRQQEVVRPLVAPEGSQPGDLVHLDGSCPPAAYPKVLKLEEWRKVVPGLVVSGGKATFEGTPLMASAGVVTVPPEISEGAGIH